MYGAREQCPGITNTLGFLHAIVFTINKSCIARIRQYVLFCFVKARLGTGDNSLRVNLHKFFFLNVLTSNCLKKYPEVDNCFF